MHIKYVTPDHDRHGRTRLYFRRGRGTKKVRLPDDPESPAFHAAYAACLAGKPLAEPKPVAGFGTVSHAIQLYYASLEYVRGEVYTNTVEGYFSIFKRGMKGIYQHCSEKHLVRYLAEFDFRYNAREALGVNDKARTALALKGAAGKRLTYRRTHERA